MKFEIAKALAQSRSYGLCEGCRAFTALDPHHRMTRGSGGVHGVAADVSNDPRNLLMLCRSCHDQTLNAADECIAIGWVIERHGALYAQELGWDERFEALVAKIAARFIERFDPARERCWIAERDGERVGSVFVVKRTPSVAQLRLLLVDDAGIEIGVDGHLFAGHGVQSETRAHF